MVDFACPKCKTKLESIKKMDSLICNKCESKFPIKDGIPILLIDSVEPLDLEDISDSNQSWKQSN